jgi:hypothetical protein
LIASCQNKIEDDLLSRKEVQAERDLDHIFWKSDAQLEILKKLIK